MKSLSHIKRNVTNPNVFTFMSHYSHVLDQIDINILFSYIIFEIDFNIDPHDFALGSFYETSIQSIHINFYKLFEGKTKSKDGFDSFSIHKFKEWISKSDYPKKKSIIEEIKTFQNKLRNNKELRDYLINDLLYFRNNFFGHIKGDGQTGYSFNFDYSQQIVNLYYSLVRNINIISGTPIDEKGEFRFNRKIKLIDFFKRTYKENKAATRFLNTTEEKITEAFKLNSGYRYS